MHYFSDVSGVGVRSIKFCQVLCFALSADR